MIQGRLGAIFALLTVFTLNAQAKDFPAVPGEYVVKLRRGVDSATVRSLNSTYKQTISAKENLFLVSRSILETRASVLESMGHHPLVEYVEPNYIYRVNGGSSTLPTDPRLGELWGMINSGQQVVGDSGTFQAKFGVDIDAKRAWMLETGSREVIVAVIDTGVNINNPDLVPNLYTNEAELNGQPGVDDDHNGCVDDIHGCDFVGNDGNPMDVFGHGTHVSGTIGAAANDGNGIVGVAWNVRLLPVRFLNDQGGGTLADAVKAIDYATSMKVNIMNNSWSGGGFSQALMDAIVRAKEAGILFVAAAGNNGNDLDAAPEYPASYPVDNIVAVAAVDPTGALASFSNYGKNSVHIAAPGVDVLSYTMNGLESWSGTSMACPHVVGVAALLLSQDSKQDYLTIKNRLLSSARPLAGTRNRVATGLVNAYYALTNGTPPKDPDDPFEWQKDAQTATTLHPYAANTTSDWTFTVPGAKRISVYFSRFDTEPTYDKVTFKNAAGDVVGTLSGKLGEVFSPVIEGDTVTMTFSSDDTVNSYGFDMGGVAYQ